MKLSKCSLLIALHFACTNSSLFAHADHYHGNTQTSEIQLLVEEHQRTIQFLESALEKNPEDVSFLIKLGKLQLELGRISGLHPEFRKALKAFDRALLINPSAASALAGRAQANLGVHDFAGGLADVRLARELDPEEEILQLLEVDCLFALGRYAEASEGIDKLYSAENITVENASRKAQLEEVRGNFDQALEFYNEAYQAGVLLEASETELAWCLTMMGDVYRLRLKDSEKALEFFNQANTLAPNSPEIHYRIALTKLLLGGAKNIEDSKITLQQLCLENPNQPRYWVALGEAHQQSGETVKAQLRFDHALQIWESEYQQQEIGHVREYAQFLLSHNQNVERALELALMDFETVRQDVEAYELAIDALQRNGQTERAKTLTTMLAEKIKF